MNYVGQMAGLIIQLSTVLESVHMWNSCRAKDNDFEAIIATCAASTAVIISFHRIHHSAAEHRITRPFAVTNETVFSGYTVIYATVPYASFDASQNTYKVTVDSFVNPVNQRVSSSLNMLLSRRRK